MLKNTSFLLIDDDSDDTYLFEEVLDEIDPAILFRSCINGHDALEILKSKQHALPDIIFLDLNMPGMDGKECLAQLKKDADLKQIAVIIYTTSSLAKDIELTMQTGAAGFITKPDSVRELKVILAAKSDGVKHNKLQKVMYNLSNSSTTFIVC